MKFLFCLTAVIAISLASHSHSDTIRYKDGKTITAIIEEKSADSVTVTLYGQKIEIPLGHIESIEKSTAEENAELKADWKMLDKQYKKESRQSEERAAQFNSPIKPPSEILAPKRPAGRPVTHTPPRPAVAAFPPAGAPEARPAEDKLRNKLLWKQKVRKAIYEERVILGMTQKEVKSTWGWPEHTNPVHGIDTYTDRWTYRREGEGLVDLYFMNEILINIGR